MSPPALPTSNGQLILVLVAGIPGMAASLSKKLGVRYHTMANVFTYGGGEGVMYTRCQIMLDLCQNGIAIMESCSQILFNHRSKGIYPAIPEMEEILESAIRTIVLSPPYGERSGNKYLDALLDSAESFNPSSADGEIDEIALTLSTSIPFAKRAEGAGETCDNQPETRPLEFRPKQARILVSYQDPKKGENYHHITLYHQDSSSSPDPLSPNSPIKEWSLDLHRKAEVLVRQVYGNTQPAFLIVMEAKQPGRKTIKYSFLMMVKELWPGHLTHITVSSGQLPPATSKIFVEAIRDFLPEDCQEPSLEELRNVLTELTVVVTEPGKIVHRFVPACREVVIRGPDGKPEFDEIGKPIKQSVMDDPVLVQVSIHDVFAGNS